MVWIGIASIIIGVVFGILKHDFGKQWIRRALKLKSDMPVNIVTFILIPVTGFVGIYALILTQTARESAEERLKQAQKKVNILEEEVVKLNPYQQPLVTFTATMQLIVKSDTQIRDGTSQGGGAFLLLSKGKVPLLSAESNRQSVYRAGVGQIEHTSVLGMDINSPARGKPISFLQETDSIKLVFHLMGDGNSGIEMNSEILYGRVVWNINNVIPLTFPIPKQTVKGKEIFIPDIDKVLRNCSTPLMKPLDVFPVRTG